MIFVTVGTNTEMGFDRLIQAADDAASALDEPMIIQRGCAQYEPQHAEHFRFDSSGRIDQLNREARIIISHAAAGAIIFALRSGKPLIVVPRLQQFNEGIDDHQLELAKALETRNRAIPIYEPSKQAFLDAIEESTNLNLSELKSSTLVNALRQKVHSWGSPPTPTNALRTSGLS